MIDKTHIVIYTLKNCMPCKMTLKMLEKQNIPFVDSYYGNESHSNLIDIASEDERKEGWSRSKIEKIKSKYKISSMPFLKVVDAEGKLLDYWAGFNPKKINQWFEKDGTPKY